jgi:hypothetical protein
LLALQDVFLAPATSVLGITFFVGLDGQHPLLFSPYFGLVWFGFNINSYASIVYIFLEHS